MSVIGFIFAILAFVVAWLWMKFQGYKKKSVFCNMKTCTPRPIEMDKEKRKKVLKRAFSLDKVPQDLDAIIVGSGMGSLTSAGFMARSGKKVLVLEQHDRVGGCTHTYKHKGCEYDIGIHYVGNMEPGSLNRCLLDFLTDSQLDWVELDSVFDTVVINKSETEAKQYPCTKGAKNFQKQLLQLFPGEAKAIDQYFRLLHKCRSASTVFVIIKMLPIFLLKALIFLKLHKIFFPGFNYLTRRSVKDILDNLTTNKDLKAVLAYPWGDYGVFPSESCFLMHGMLLNHMLRTGGFYPKGGASEIAYQMIPGILRAGGEVLTRAQVGEILIENGKACGVKVFLKKSKSPPCEIRAPIVISGAGIYNTYQTMMPKYISEKYQVMKNLDWLKPGLTCLQIMVGLNGTKEELNLPAKNFWIFSSDDPNTEAQEYLSMTKADAANSPIPLLFASFPSAKDPTWKDRFPGKSTCVVVTFSSLSWFEEWKDADVKKRGAVYNNLKSSFVNQAWKQVLVHFPHLEDKVESLEGGTPLSHMHYLNSMHGEIYGAHHNMERFYFENAAKLSAGTPIPDLYLTGQDIFTCGFIGAAFSGLITASKVLNRFIILDLINHVKDVRRLRAKLSAS
ncbi:all-trans-retinol 13,14-reductase-like [Clavelina lepadiformis]|uniref:all-trans-retinol 13,14-reductase-like n=1 Tax=Clavelina lepadiformis TaxID=159417 RepID=UPI0040425CFE